MLYIPRRRLLLLAVIIPMIAAYICYAIWFFASTQSRRSIVSIPAWIELGHGPPVTYIDDYAQGVSLSAESAILIENTTGTILFAKNEHVRRAPASTTKILTALLTLETARLSDQITVSRHAAWTPGSTARLYAGQKLTVEEALYGMMLRSGNDAAVALAEHISGSVTEFAKLMNTRSQELGAANSRWQNPHGLDKPGHYSTAFDLAMIARVALLYPKFAEIVGTKTYGSWNNTNRLLWSYAGADGVKTGTTSQAGHCLVAAASRDGRQLISVVLKSKDRWTDSTRLLDYGFNNFRLVPIARAGQIMAEIKIENGMSPVVKAAAPQDWHQVLKNKDADKLQLKVAIEPLSAPIAKGSKVGELVAYLGEEELGSLPLVAAETVHRRTLWRLLLQKLQLLQGRISGH